MLPLRNLNWRIQVNARFQPRLPQRVIQRFTVIPELLRDSGAFLTTQYASTVEGPLKKHRIMASSASEVPLCRKGLVSCQECSAPGLSQSPIVGVPLEAVTLNGQRR
jgi:hypothetical protein